MNWCLLFSRVRTSYVGRIIEGGSRRGDDAGGEEEKRCEEASVAWVGWGARHEWVDVQMG